MMSPYSGEIASDAVFTLTHSAKYEVDVCSHTGISSSMLVERSQAHLCSVVHDQTPTISATHTHKSMQRLPLSTFCL